MPSKFVYVVTNGKISMFWKDEWYFIVSISYVFRAVLQWTLACRHLFEILILFPLGICAEAGLLDHLVVAFLTFWGSTIVFCTAAVPIYIPTDCVQAFPFLCTLASTCYLLSFDNSHSNRCGVISHCGFGWYFPDGWF